MEGAAGEAPLRKRIAFAVTAGLMIAAIVALQARATQQQTPPPAPQQPNTPPSTSANAAPSASTHVIQVQFDYDFSKTRACTNKIRTKCVDQFVIYNVYIGARNQEHRIKLGVIPLPESPKGLVKGIAGKTASLPFSSGEHKIIVVAHEPDNAESSPEAASVMVTIP